MNVEKSLSRIYCEGEHNRYVAAAALAIGSKTKIAEGSGDDEQQRSKNTTFIFIMIKFYDLHPLRERRTAGKPTLLTPHGFQDH